ncbi:MULTISPECIES: sigma-E factor negative regulatory protein [unclassified Caballeronia]|uniref:sigma-E factor negative regulatory protein n=1 Tax=unclassified Caballeronia TaxID=2646786 RepID=UPI002865B9E0|nr:MULTISPECIES: sigma-E factor negative regulatory protein [unclassified Caballeronia]MDR5737870.1 sigma-E factor negative regulatory protein [Caballeronia sp. LZ016]MDR5809594.1 sigma-E factor negative regulatory protein [Caballeronia sp. LZ019]
MGSVSMQAHGNSQTHSQAGTRGERMSAFVDGESLDEIQNISQFLAGLTSQDRAAWSDYHLIGDALRSDDLAESPVRSSAFMSAFSARFEAEAHVLAPAALPAQKARGGLLRRRVVPAFAVAAAAATLTWIVVPQLQGVGSQSGAQVASVAQTEPVQRVALASVPAVSTASPVVEANIIRDANLDQYLEAHQQFSQQPAMPGSMPLIRAAVTSQGQ